MVELLNLMYIIINIFNFIHNQQSHDLLGSLFMRGA